MSAGQILQVISSDSGQTILMHAGSKELQWFDWDIWSRPWHDLLFPWKMKNALIMIHAFIW